MPTFNNPGQQIREAAQARAAEIRADAQANAAGIRADAHATAEAGRAHGMEVRDMARAEADLTQERALVSRLTGDTDFLQADHFAYTQLTALNGSGVSGSALFGYDDQTHTLTVAISADGLEANQPHVQHIHGFLDGTDAHTPTLAQDADGDGYVELGEGLATYGQILLNLATNHDNANGGDNGHSHDGAVTGFPTAPDGREWFVESYQLPQGDLGVDPMLALRELVIHGMTVPAGAGAGTPGEVDGTAGYKLVLPVASGEISEATSAQQLRAFIQDTGFDDASRQQMHEGWMIG